MSSEEPQLDGNQQEDNQNESDHQGDVSPSQENIQAGEEDFPEYQNEQEEEENNNEDDEIQNLGSHANNQRDEEQEEHNVKRASNNQAQSKGNEGNSLSDEQKQKIRQTQEQNADNSKGEITEADLATNQLSSEKVNLSKPVGDQKGKNEGNKGQKDLITPVKLYKKKNRLAQQEGGQNLFSQFQDEILDLYRNAEKAFKSIDKNHKGFIEEADLAIELETKLGIDDQAHHKEIFSLLSNGSAQINQESFVNSFSSKVEERRQHQQALLDTMNVVPNSYDSTDSPFKDKSKRDEIIKIFQKESVVNLEDANKEEHFDPDSKYAPVVRKLRQQTTFDEYVRSYNTLSFPKAQQPDPVLFDTPNYDPFSHIPQSRTNSNHLFSPVQQGILTNSSPSRQKQFSPLRLSIESKEWIKKGTNKTEQNSSQPKFSYIDGTGFRKNENAYNSSFIKSANDNYNLYASQEFNSSSKLSPKSLQGQNFQGSTFGLGKLSSSNFFSSNKNQLSPNFQTNALKNTFNTGNDSLSSSFKRTDLGSSFHQNSSNKGFIEGTIRNQFNRFMNQVGFENQRRLGAPQFEGNVKLDGFLEKIQNSSSDKRKQPYSSSEASKYRGIQGQVQRIKVIQSSLRSFPKNNSPYKQNKLNGLGNMNWDRPSKLSVPSPQAFNRKNEPASFFSNRY